MEGGHSKAAFIFDLVIMYICFFYIHLRLVGHKHISSVSILLMLIIAIAWYFISIYSKILKICRRTNISRMLIDIFVGYSVLTAIIIFLVAYFGHFRDNDKLILYPLLFSALICSNYRMICILSTRHLVKNGYQKKSILLIGGGHLAERVMKQILRYPELGYHLHGFITDCYHPSMKKGFFLGGLDRFDEIIQTNQIDEVIIAKPLRLEKIIFTLVDKCEKEGIRFHIVPDFYRVVRNRAVLDSLGDIPMIAIRTEPLNIICNRFIKRLFDLALATLLLLVLSPLFIVLSLVIKITSKGPIFFKQKRIGANHQEFTIYKFRSMRMQNEKASDTVWTTASDNRVTRIGEFIRQTNIDELPQLWNVVIGNMSLVGPRPERNHFVEKFRNEIPRYKVRHLVKSGITGWAQVNGWRGDTSIRKRVEHDLWYLENWSFWLDLKILWLTLFSRRAYQNAY